MAEPNLTRAAIVAAALALLDESGLDDLSLRKVALRLGVKAPSLYWHVEDKGALLALVAEGVFRRCLESIPECADWPAWLRAFGRALWRAQRATRDSARLILNAPIPEARLAEIADTIVARLAGFGLEPAAALRMQSSVQALITGWSGFAQSPSAAFIAASFDIEAAVHDSLDRLIAGWAANRDRSADRATATA